MRRLSVLCTAAGLAVTALAATSPAEASYHLIRWHGTGICQIWDDSIPTKPFPSDYRRVSGQIPTLLGAIAAKDALWHKGICSI
jgi:hypothetical protein